MYDVVAPVPKATHGRPEHTTTALNIRPESAAEKAHSSPSRKADVIASLRVQLMEGADAITAIRSLVAQYGRRTVAAYRSEVVSTVNQEAGILGFLYVTPLDYPSERHASEARNRWALYRHFVPSIWASVETATFHPRLVLPAGAGVGQLKQRLLSHGARARLAVGDHVVTAADVSTVLHAVKQCPGLTMSRAFVSRIASIGDPRAAVRQIFADIRQGLLASPPRPVSITEPAGIDLRPPVPISVRARGAVDIPATPSTSRSEGVLFASASQATLNQDPHPRTRAANASHSAIRTPQKAAADVTKGPEVEIPLTKEVRQFSLRRSTLSGVKADKRAPSSGVTLKPRTLDSQMPVPTARAANRSVTELKEVDIQASRSPARSRQSVSLPVVDMPLSRE